MSVQQGISIHTAPEHLKPALRLIVFESRLRELCNNKEQRDVLPVQPGNWVKLPSGGYFVFGGELPANRDAVLVSADELEERGELNKALILRSISKLYRE